MGCRRYTLTQLDMGSLMRPAGIPIESKLYLIGSVVTGQDLFWYFGVAGLGRRCDLVYRSAMAKTQGSTSIGRPRFIANFLSSTPLRFPPKRTRACSHCWRRSPESVGRTCSVQDADNLHSTPGGVAYAA
jgi:hypothetical protein